jgi:serine/threonine-protein kinase
VTLIGRYRVEGLLGLGGMGRVHRALDTVLGRRVALKVLATTEGDPRAAVHAARLLREARAAAALDHPNVVALYDVGEHEGAPFIAMELVEGCSLRRLIAGAAPWPQRVRWLAEIASALDAAHRAGLIHRDVKPDNVMIRRDGRAKVLDFGIARLTAQAEDESLAPLTSDGLVVGTPRYMAPEQLRREALDGRSDQFSWGVLAYELLAKRLPWQGDAVAVIAATLTVEPPPLATLRPELPEPITSAVMRALRKDPAERFPSMREIVAVLEPFAAPPEPLAMEPAPADDEATDEAPASPRRARSATTHPFTSEEGPALGPSPEARSLTAQPFTAARAEPAPPPNRGRMRRAAAIAVGAAIAIGAAITVRAKMSPPPSSRAAVVPTAITDLPTPSSHSLAAVAAYREGLQASRDGVMFPPGFRRAARLDPGMAEAHLQKASRAILYFVDDGTRAHFRAASGLRAALSPRDLALLELLDPVLAREPSDWSEATRRAREAAERFPGDAQLRMLLGALEGFVSPERAHEELVRALALDPRYGDALGADADILAILGRFDEAKERLAACRAASSTGHNLCDKIEIRLHEQEGDCDAMEESARRIIAKADEDGNGSEYLPEALAGRGAPLAAVREAWRQALASRGGGLRWEEPVGLVRLDLLAGDFEAAAADLRALDQQIESVRPERVHAMAALLHAQILEELGRAREAADLAEDFIARRPAWEPDPRADNIAMAGDVEPALIATARAGGRLDARELAARRASWLARWERRGAAADRAFVWMHGWAASAATPEEAREALDAQARYGPLPSYRPNTLVEAYVGRTFLLAGRADEAARWLDVAARRCRALSAPVEHTRAHLWLGLAREALGDRARACAAYRAVLDRWGHARPRSATADRARERSAALGCDAR